MHIKKKVSQSLSFSVITDQASSCLDSRLKLTTYTPSLSKEGARRNTGQVSKDKRDSGEMGVKVIQCSIFLLGFLFSSGTFGKDLEEQTHSLLSSHPAFHLQISKLEDLLPDKPPPHRLLIPVSDTESLDTMPQLDVTTPTSTVPTINPSTPTPTTTTPTYSNPTPTYTNPTPTYSNPTPTDSTPTYSNPTPTGTPVTNPYTTPTSPYTTPTTTPTTGTPTTTPTTGTPSTSSSQSWCVASQSASETALQVALDYACGYGGSDCTAIQQGGSCFNPDTLRDHASYAFNSYYQKNPVPTSCDFGGTAMITNTDPSTSTCQYPSSSTNSSTPNPTSTTSPTSPTGSTVYGSSPPDYGSTGGTISKAISMPPSFSLMILLLSLVYFKVYE